MRGFFKFLFGLFFVIACYILVILFVVKTTLLSGNFIQNELEKKNVYVRVYELIPDITNLVITEATKGEGGTKESGELSSEEIGRVISKSITPELLKNKTEFLISGVYNWVNGKTGELPGISFLDVKPKIEEYAAAEMDVPVEYVRSQQFGLNLPDKLEIKVAPPLLLLKRIVSGWTIASTILIGICLVSIIAIVLLSKDWPKRVKSPGSSMIIVSVFLFLTAGLLWLFPNAGNLLLREISASLGSSPAVATLVYDMTNGLIMSVVVKIATLAGALLGLGIVLAIVGFVIKKVVKPKKETKDQKVVENEETEAKS